MKVLQPRFYSAFHCIASACTDNCCIGWEIDIDPETDRFYRSVPGDFGRELMEGIDRKGGAHFRLDPKDRCPFLDARNLCRIHQHLGPEHLCEICRQHPRFFEWLDGRVEAGLGLCCEEACRLLLSDPAPLTFVMGSDSEPGVPFDGDSDLLRRLECARQELFTLLQDRALPFAQRLGALVPRASALQDELDGFEPQPPLLSPPPAPDALFALLYSLEPIDESWTRLLDQAQDHPGSPVPVADWMLEHAGVYLLYRWFLKAVWDGDALGKARLAALFLYSLELLLDRGAFSSPEEGLRLLSKEIEYSEENTNLLQDCPLLG